MWHRWRPPENESSTFKEWARIVPPQPHRIGLAHVGVDVNGSRRSMRTVWPVNTCGVGFFIRSLQYPCYAHDKSCMSGYVDLTHFLVRLREKASTTHKHAMIATIFPTWEVLVCACGLDFGLDPELLSFLSLSFFLPLPTLNYGRTTITRVS